ncbi:hypothetical protein [Chryseobacterium sp. CFS15]|uniref:hypothetical protein n=1 Tax=Chryseobacterium sp. CFS15 TaxID=2986946 RepID=UPI0028089950|nr:hypothetical protein [Chryseobacterium sp. CFS15]MDQ8143038.1 hypothetical protein [Chryseobacterium sp. CFS15]
MDKIINFQDQIVEIQDFQSTYIILRYQERLYRFDFINKKEAFLKQKEIGNFSFYQLHPLLINYNESMYDVFLNSKPECPNKFIEDIKYSINYIIQEWRSWKSYIEFDSGITYDVFLQNLHKGSGKLMRVPISIMEKLKELTDQNNIKISYFGEKNFSQNQLIMINNQYIIAENFRLHLI